jgi:hypothetical protein
MRSLLSHPSRLWSLSLVACGTVFASATASAHGPVCSSLKSLPTAPEQNRTCECLVPSEASDIAPDSDGLIYSHIGKLGAMFGGIGITANYRSGPAASLATGAEDLALIVAWIRKRVADFGGDPDTSSCWQIPTARRLLRDTC